MRHKFVDLEPGGALLSRMLKGGLNAEVIGSTFEQPTNDEVFVTVVEGEEWTDMDAWIRAIEEHYACVFDTTAE